MKLRVVEKHDGEGVFPLFRKGTPVHDIKPCDNTPHWLSCTIEGRETYIPETYIANSTLIQDYNPTELIVRKDQIITLISIVFEWLYVEDENGNEGWLYANKVISI